MWSGRTGSNGQAVANGLTAGVYQLTWSDSLPWGGVNAADALAINRHFAATSLLLGLFKKAADVNGNGSINSTDALLVSRRFTGSITSFSSGNWVFDRTNLSLSPGINAKSVLGVCVGDVNGSHIP
jgi:hypothetical protein